MSKPEKPVDPVTGVETTGHEWDGIAELNKPLPRWWLWTFYVCIAWSVGYWVLYPAWPTFKGYTKGTLYYSQRTTVTEEVLSAKAKQRTFREQLAATGVEKVKANPELLRFAMAAGKAAFGENCAGCHGRGAQGGAGYPNLNDDEWMWGGKIADIEQTIQHGIRWQQNDKTRVSDMPRFGLDQLLQPAQINDLAEYVVSLSGTPQDPAAAQRGGALFKEQCVACHGDNGKGNREFGAPNLTDSVWLYGSSKADIVTSIRTGRGGRMPAWQSRLDPLTIKSLALYVHTLGGGE